MNIIRKIVQILQDTCERPIICKTFEEINNPSIKFAYEKITKLYSLKNKNILDFGCGGGYGTEFLSRYTKKSVVGYDIDQKTIKINKKFYENIKNLKFTSNQKELKKYNFIVCFQVIEHLDMLEAKSLIKFLKKSLLPNGIIIFATPNKNITSYNLKKPVMVFHKIEYTNKTLKHLLKKYFNKVDIQGQILESVVKNKIKENYNKKKYNINTKIIRFISQIEIIRSISRHLPMNFKRFFMGKSKVDIEKYQLTKKTI